MNKKSRKSEIGSKKTPEYIAMTYFLRQRRKALNMTMVELASKLGVSAQLISTIETNKRRLDIFELNALCVVLDLKVSEVINYMFVESNQLQATDINRRAKSIRLVSGKSNY